MTENEFINEIFALAQSDEIKQMADDIIENAKRKKTSVELKEVEIFKVLNASYIAKRFFNKSRFWISQKINHNITNGKPAEFSNAERETLKNALKTIAFELQNLADEI